MAGRPEYRQNRYFESAFRESPVKRKGPKAEMLTSGGRRPEACCLAEVLIYVSTRIVARWRSTISGTSSDVTLVYQMSSG